jgi:hypothetical protein
MSGERSRRLSSLGLGWGIGESGEGLRERGRGFECYIPRVGNCKIQMARGG